MRALFRTACGAQQWGEVEKSARSWVIALRPSLCDSQFVSDKLGVVDTRTRVFHRVGKGHDDEGEFLVFREET